MLADWEEELDVVGALDEVEVVVAESEELEPDIEILEPLGIVETPEDVGVTVLVSSASRLDVGEGGVTAVLERVVDEGVGDGSIVSEVRGRVVGSSSSSVAEV